MDDVPGEQSSSRGPDFIDCHSIGILVRAIPVYDFETSELVAEAEILKAVLKRDYLTNSGQIDRIFVRSCGIVHDRQINES